MPRKKPPPDPNAEPPKRSSVIEEREMLRVEVMAQLRTLLGERVTSIVPHAINRIRIINAPVIDTITIFEATGFIDWLEMRHATGTYREFSQPYKAPTGDTAKLAIDNQRMVTALLKIRAMCMEKTGRKNDKGEFIPFQFGEVIGKIAGEAVTGLSGGE